MGGPRLGLGLIKGRALCEGADVAAGKIEPRLLLGANT